MLWYLAKLTSQVALLRRWASPGFAGVLVAEPLQALRLFCEAHSIEFVGGSVGKASPSKLSMASLARLHFECGIDGVEISHGKDTSVTFKIMKMSATIVEYQRSIEQDFVNAFGVVVVFPQ
jgi:hypothetical protein